MKTKILSNIALGFVGMFIAGVYAYNELIKKTDQNLERKNREQV